MRYEEYFGANMRFYRKQKGLSQEKLAELLNVSVRHIQVLESGSTLPSLALAIHIADLFNTGLDDLMGLTNVKPNEFMEAVSNLNSQERRKAYEIFLALAELFR